MEFENQNNELNSLFAEEEEKNTTFNVIDWIMRCLHHWYLFVIGVVIALAVAYYLNRSYIPTFSSFTSILIEQQQGSIAANDLTRGFGASFSSNQTIMENQRLILHSYDLISRTVDNLPQLQASFFSKGRFKVRPKNDVSPIAIDTISTTPFATYDKYYQFTKKDNNSFTITVFDSDDKSIESIDGVYGEPVGNQNFLIIVNKNAPYFDYTNNIYFTLKNRHNLIVEFSSRLYIENIKGSSVLSMSLSSNDPYRDRLFLKQHATSFLENNLDIKNYEADKTIRFINDQLAVISDSLDRSEEELNNYKISSQTFGDNMTTVLSTKMTSLEERGKQLKLKDAYFKYLKNYLRSNIEDESLTSPSSIGIQEPRLIALVDRYNELQVELIDLGVKNPQYEIVSNRIKQIKSQLDELLTSVTDVYKIEKELYDKDVAELNSRLMEAPAKELTMMGYQRKFNVNDNYYTYLLQKLSEAQIRKASNFPDHTVLQGAITGEVTNMRDKMNRYIMALIIGLLIPLLLVILKEKMNVVIRTESDVDKATKSRFSVIGYIRHTNHKEEDKVIAAKYPNSFFVEQLRVIRTKVELILQRHKNITVMISSAESGDGKTYVSLNLAGVFAMHNPKVLLVDFDVRKLNLTQYIEEELSNKQTGYVNYIIGDCTLDEAIEKTSYGFDFLKAGALPPNPGEFVRSSKVKDMFLELKERYDYIVVDTSPVGLVTDCYAIFPVVDVKLLIARCFKTNKYGFADLARRLNQDKIDDIYIVMNDYDKIKSGYGRSYGYGGYGYGYGYGYGQMRKKIGNYYVTEDFEKEEETITQKIFGRFMDLIEKFRNRKK